MKWRLRANCGWDICWEYLWAEVRDVVRGTNYPQIRNILAFYRANAYIIVLRGRCGTLPILGRCSWRGRPGLRGGWRRGTRIVRGGGGRGRSYWCFWSFGGWNRWTPIWGCRGRWLRLRRRGRRVDGRTAEFLLVLGSSGKLADWLIRRLGPVGSRFGRFGVVLCCRLVVRWICWRPVLRCIICFREFIGFILFRICRGWSITNFREIWRTKNVLIFWITPKHCSFFLFLFWFTRNYWKFPWLWGWKCCGPFQVGVGGRRRGNLKNIGFLSWLGGSGRVSRGRSIGPFIFGLVLGRLSTILSSDFPCVVTVIISAEILTSKNASQNF